ncbi:MAG: hydantoinase B/oxoprolinase family protein [Planctomycetota bacterium]|nr:hydantoinase B/oxoprolinase family protein [Planctomycetota bacterium]
MNDPNSTKPADKKPVAKAWIDVGGTFTDCFVLLGKSDLRSCKLLSSGRVPISIESSSRVGTKSYLQSREVRQDTPDFWTGARLRVLDAEQTELAHLTVLAFQPSESGPFHLLLDGQLPEGGSHFELDAGLEAPVLGIRRLLGVPIQESLPPLKVSLGTTRGTNALLTRTGASTVFAVTAPFRDLMTIGDQTRNDLFALDIEKPKPLAESVIEIHERLDADGKVLLELDEEAAAATLKEAFERGRTSLAICLMHSYANPAHEQRIKELAQQVGFQNISVSSQLAPLIEIIARAQTTIVDAYLSPIIRQYLRDLLQQFGGEQNVDLQVMTSAGGMVPWQSYSGKDSILSGPAGGVRALQALAAAHGVAEVIGLDMGGTSTDVCRVAKEPEIQYESRKAGVRLLTPTLPIETVAAGGGSICWFDGVSLRVGPQSAGSMPGPACYGRGGPLTVTDLNVYLKRVPTDQFPFPVHLHAIEERLEELLAQTRSVANFGTKQALCQGLRKIANEQMAEAVRSVSIAQGADPRRSTLVGFGGAAGQHICEIAESLEIASILDYPHAGLLSALGMGLAKPRCDATLPVYSLLGDLDWEALDTRLNTSLQELVRPNSPGNSLSEQSTTEVWLEMRYQGTESSLRVAFHTKMAEKAERQLAEAFHHLHQARFGYRRKEHPIELVAIRFENTAQAAWTLETAITDPESEIRTFTKRDSYERDSLKSGDVILGPCVVCNSGSTLYLAAGWKATCRRDGSLFLETTDDSSATDETNVPAESDQSADVVFRDCYAARLSAIATQMGLVLQQTAVSVNVKQRRDYSCAVFDSSGMLLANAPHVPVHLGAMGQTVRATMDAFPEMQSGDVFVTNDPYQGGSHLPDLTVITPVFCSEKSSPVMFVANRAHHADVGGISPGSMSTQATRLGQEGAVIAPMHLYAAGESRLLDFREFLMSASHPPRNVEENLADIGAQCAANERGLELLEQYAASESWARLNDYAEHLLAAAEQRVIKFLQEHKLQKSQFKDELDDGSRICVTLTPSSEGRLKVDFTGTSQENAGNFNANPSIVSAGTIYVIRCLIGDDMPLNEGVLRAVELTIPPGLLNPRPAPERNNSPAVAAGNVETSQRVVDVLLGALGAAAASQGTMNNLLFGNEHFGFYETICGGSGATANRSGAHCVHTHMTNTRLTDPEVLEKRYPIRLIACAQRVGSGGAGAQRGGDGLIREIEFLEHVSVSLLMSRRSTQPFGLQGGGSGAAGENRLTSVEGNSSLDGCCNFEAQPGDRLQIKTPGGGGLGYD